MRPTVPCPRFTIVSALALMATAFVSARDVGGFQGEPTPRVAEELVHARTSDGITNGGVMCGASPGSASTTAVLWIHGSQVNFYEPPYVKICRELAARGFTTLIGNTRMHDLGTIAAFRDGTRVRGGTYWGKTSEQVHDLKAWIDFAFSRGYTGVVLAGHSAGAFAAQAYEAETQDPRVLGLVLASGRVRPAPPLDPERVAQARKLVGEGLGEAMLPNPTRPTSFVSAATFLDLADLEQQLTDFFGVQAADPPVSRISCPILAWFGTEESDIGTAADLELLKSTLARLPRGPSRVDTVVLRDAGHMYDGEEAQVARTIATWVLSLAPASSSSPPK